MKVIHLIAVAVIFLCTTVGWFVLGSSLSFRTAHSDAELRQAVSGVWGPPMMQPHPKIWYESPGARDGRHYIQPADSKVNVTLSYEPKQKGLLWYRTYGVVFDGHYRIENPTPITQTIYVRFDFPSESASYQNFVFRINKTDTTQERKASEGIIETVQLEPGAQAEFQVGYTTRGTDRWTYHFSDAPRIRKFALSMKTNFADIDFPAGSSSPTKRSYSKDGWQLDWLYPDVIGAQPIAMEMPKVLNPGPVASRITFFAPVSLLFFFTVLLILAVVRQRDFHPMHFFFLAASCFAFQLLFAYTVDWLPIHAAFALAAAVSLGLVIGYLKLAFDLRLAIEAGIALFAYMILFSYSFFFDGLTGITITVGAIATLAVLMVFTARVNWSEKFATSRSRSRAQRNPVNPPPMPA